MDYWSLSTKKNILQQSEKKSYNDLKKILQRSEKKSHNDLSNSRHFGGLNFTLFGQADVRCFSTNIMLNYLTETDVNLKGFEN